MRPLWLLLFALVAMPSVLVAQSKPKVRVVAVLDGGSPAFDRALSDLESEIELQLGDRYDVEFLPTLEGNWTAAGAKQQLDEAYADTTIDAVFGFGPLTVAEVAVKRRLPKPTILPFVIGGTGENLPRRGDVSGAENLSYIIEDLDFSSEADRLHQVCGASNIVILAEDFESTMVSDAVRGSLPVATANADVAALLAAIPTSADGVILAPMRRLSLPQQQRLIDGLIQRRLPHVAVNPYWIEQGAMMAVRSPENERRRAQRAALNLDLILEGRPSSKIVVDFDDREDLTLNVATMTAIGIRPTFEVLLEATLVDDGVLGDPGRIKLSTAMLDSVDANLDLLVSEKFVEAGEQQVNVTRGPLLPQAKFDMGVIAQDPDRVPIGGQVAARQALWTVRASQSVYSEAAWTRFKSTKLRQEGREYGYFDTVLDIMLQAGVAYVGVLRAEAQERIQRRNIQLTKEYLELASLRLEVGVANASELYRWQVTLAENQRAVVDASAFVSQSKIELNRVLNRPSEQPIEPIDLPRNAEGRTKAPDDPIGAYMNDPYSFRLLREFMVEEGLRNSPAARQVERRLEAEERIRAGRTRELWLPEFFIEGGVQNDFWRQGPGAVTPPNDLGIPQPDKFGWDVGAYLSLPLSRGGSKVAEMKQAAILVERLNAEFARVEQEIDVSVRTELYNAAAAHMSVRLTRKEAEAADRNLRLVVDLYRRGKVDIITLVDAQTQSLVADLAAADAVYDYLIALLFVNREAGHFRNLDTPEARAGFSRRLNEFVMAAENGSLVESSPSTDTVR